MRLHQIFSVSNEGGYKILFLFGWKIRFRSRIRTLRLRLNELQDKHDRLERNFRQQGKEFQQVTARFNALISTLETQLQEQRMRSCEKWNQTEQDVQQVARNVIHVEQELLQVTETQREHQSATEQRITAVAAYNKTETEAVAARVCALEKLNLAEECGRNQQAIGAIEKRVAEIETLDLKTLCASNEAATESLARRVAGIEAQQLGVSCAQNAAVAKTLDTRLTAMEKQQLQIRSKENRVEIQKVREWLKSLDNRTKPLSARRTFNFVKARSMQAINRDYVASMVENMYEKGVSDSTDKPRLIVSLTSYPKRMYDIHLCLYSLLTQDLKPDKVILWLAKEQFPHRSKDVPKKVRDLKKFGLEIKWCSDLKSYKKLIPALQQYPDTCIVTADDDIYYPQNWLRGLWETYQHTGAGVVAHRCHEAAYEGDAFLPYAKWSKCIEREDPAYTNFMTGAGGILYAPGCFHSDIMNVDKFQELCPHGDDIWFWTMALLNGTKIAIPPQPYKDLVYTNPEREANANDDRTLFATNGMGGNDVQLANILASYPELGEIMKNKS